MKYDPLRNVTVLGKINFPLLMNCVYYFSNCINFYVVIIYVTLLASWVVNKTRNLALFNICNCILKNEFFDGCNCRIRKIGQLNGRKNEMKIQKVVFYKIDNTSIRECYPSKTFDPSRRCNLKHKKPFSVSGYIHSSRFDHSPPITQAFIIRVIHTFLNFQMAKFDRLSVTILCPAVQRHSLFSMAGRRRT